MIKTSALSALPFLILATLTAHAASTSLPVDKPFVVYGFLPYGGYVEDDGTEVKGTPPQDYLDGSGIHKINLIYEDRVLDYPTDAHGVPDKSQGVPDLARIKKLADLAALDPATPVSLDLEGWNRFLPGTPARFLEILRDFRGFNTKSPLGLYGEAPQFTYGWYPDPGKPEEIRKHDAQNARYAPVARQVSHFSPSLYNHSLFTDTDENNEAWRKGASYDMEAARKYSTTKKVLPYITAQIGPPADSGRWLSYSEMLFRLQALKELGADGCIIWGGSGAVEPDGTRAVIDPRSGWAKAVVDFVQGAADHGKP